MLNETLLDKISTQEKYIFNYLCLLTIIIIAMAFAAVLCEINPMNFPAIIMRRI